MKFFSLLLFSIITILPAHASRVRPPVCPVFACPAPPENCTYQKAALDKRRCPTGCGELLCKPVCENALSLQCAAPPEGCNWTMTADENGCPSCGQLICESSCDNVQLPQCAAPPEGCDWTMEPNPQGCPSCGQLICKPEGGGGFKGPVGRAKKLK